MHAYANYEKYRLHSRCVGRQMNLNFRLLLYRSGIISASACKSTFRNLYVQPLLRCHIAGTIRKMYLFNIFFLKLVLNPGYIRAVTFINVWRGSSIVLLTSVSCLHFAFSTVLYQICICINRHPEFLLFVGVVSRPPCSVAFLIFISRQYYYRCIRLRISYEQLNRKRYSPECTFTYFSIHLKILSQKRENLKRSLCMLNS